MTNRKLDRPASIEEFLAAAEARWAEGSAEDIPQLVKLVRIQADALRDLGGIVKAHEHAIRADGGNTNFEIVAARLAAVEERFVRE